MIPQCARVVIAKVVDVGSGYGAGLPRGNRSIYLRVAKSAYSACGRFMMVIRACRSGLGMRLGLAMLDLPYILRGAVQ